VDAKLAQAVSQIVNGGSSIVRSQIDCVEGVGVDCALALGAGVGVDVGANPSTLLANSSTL
jgi:hypothetical protein